MKVWDNTAFNKSLSGGHGTLIGNWMEEEVMKNSTGVSRTKKNFHIPKERDLLYSLPPDEISKGLQHSNTVDSFTRVLPNSRVDAPHTTNMDYGNFEDRVKKMRKSGLRYQMIEKQFLQKSNSEWENAQKNKHAMNFNTTYNNYHNKKTAEPGTTFGKRVMKDFDGNKLPPNSRDTDLLTDYQFLDTPQQNTDEELKKLIDPNVHYSKDQPMSYWMERIHHGNLYNSKVTNNDRPFKRDNSFLKEFHHYTHKKC